VLHEGSPPPGWPPFFTYLLPLEQCKRLCDRAKSLFSQQLSYKLLVKIDNFVAVGDNDELIRF